MRKKEEEKYTDEGDTKITRGYSVLACTYVHMHLCTDTATSLYTHNLLISRSWLKNLAKTFAVKNMISLKLKYATKELLIELHAQLKQYTQFQNDISKQKPIV